MRIVGEQIAPGLFAGTLAGDSARRKVQKQKLGAQGSILFMAITYLTDCLMRKTGQRLRFNSLCLLVVAGAALRMLQWLLRLLDAPPSLPNLSSRPEEHLSLLGSKAQTLYRGALEQAAERGNMKKSDDNSQKF